MQKRTLKKLLYLIVCLWGNFFFAQTVKGKVTSGGVSLPGVSVVVQGTKKRNRNRF